jgi:hypothetical protein
LQQYRPTADTGDDPTEGSKGQLWLHRRDNYYDQVINFAQTDGRDRCNLSTNCSKKRRGAKSPFHPIGGTLAAGTFFAISLRARTPHAVVIDQGE